MRTHSIILDAGHGGGDLGAVWGNRKEKDLTLNIALDVYDGLKRQLTPFLTRSTDSAMSLQERVYMSMRYNASAFVSIHINADADPDSDDDPIAVGAEIFSHPHSHEGQRLAHLLESRLLPLTPRWRGIKDGTRLYVVRETRCPAVLVEIGFIDNPDFDFYDYHKYSEALTTGILEFMVRV